MCSGLVSLLSLCLRSEISDIVIFYKYLHKMPIENYIQTIDVNLSRGYDDCNLVKYF